MKVALPDDLARRPRVRAAEDDRSVSSRPLSGARRRDDGYFVTPVVSGTMFEV